MQTLLSDLKYAFRSLRRSPGFVLAAVVTLALGIGANTAIFSVVNAVLLRPLPYHDPNGLVMVWESNERSHHDHNVVNPANYLDWKDRARSFSELASFSWSQLVFTGDAPENVQGRAVTPNFFEVIGIAPMLGRVFTAQEALPGGPPVIVISEGLWRRRFGGEKAIVGQQVPVAGGTATVIGVMPTALRPMPWGNEEYWEPFRLDPTDRSRNGRYAMVIGRLKPGVTVAQAHAEMKTIAEGLQREYPDFDTGWSANVVTLSDQVVGASRSALLMLLGAVSLVLLIACANVGNLMLGRATVRSREVAIRTALGAPRWRIARQWLLESVIVAAVGGAVGVVLATWGVELLVRLGPHDIPRLGEIGLDTRVLATTAVVSFVVGVLFGLPTALGSGDETLAGGLHGGSNRTTADGRAARFRAGLVVAQVSLAVVLLVGAGLLLRSIARLAAIDPGFDPTNLLTVTVDLPSATYPDGVRQSAFFDQLLERVRGLPGVKAASAVSYVPLIPQGAATSFTVVGRPEPAAGQAPVADIRIIEPGYFETMRIPLLRGRALNSADGAAAPPVVMINQTMARQLWPGENPIGQRVKISWWNPEAQPEIVGVVGDVHVATLDGDFKPMIYYPATQSPSGGMTVVIRHSGAVAPVAGQVRAAVRELDPNLPVTELGTMYAKLTQSMSDRRYPMFLLLIFAGLAVALASVGIYGVLSYGVSQRTREIGVRMALGARSEEVLRLVISGGLRLTLIGVVLGAAIAAFAVRTLDKLLYGVPATDPVTFGAVALLLTAVALLACYLPARRAARVDPMVALRAE
jgi:putative ABC transport system permease protein